MTEEEHLLVIAMEECNEVSHRIAKALRFGLDQIQQDADDKPEENIALLTNKQRILIEYHHLVAIMEICNLIPHNYSIINDKKEKVRKYLIMSQKLGRLK